MYYLQLLAGFIALGLLVAVLLAFTASAAQAACTYNTVIMANGQVMTTMTCCSSNNNCITTVIQ